ncbi:MAG: hypothetical protein L0Y39_01380 [Methylococcaceae bacterium]|nr:hypothetical protein [Methylococcaceae bacterium]
MPVITAPQDAPRTLPGFRHCKRWAKACPRYPASAAMPPRPHPTGAEQTGEQRQTQQTDGENRQGADQRIKRVKGLSATHEPNRAVLALRAM